MTISAPLQTATAKPQLSSLSASSRLLQRKCACGASTSALDEKCDECKAHALQKKLAIGASNDPLEQEADRVAEQVLAKPVRPGVGRTLPKIQRFAGQAIESVGTAPASVERVLACPGRPLEPALREDMEQRFGYDFSRVRVHTGSHAEQSAREVNANAYTVGHNMVFGARQFVPGGHAGRHLIAHELTHVVQQYQAGSSSRVSVQRDAEFDVPTLDQTYRKAVQKARETGNWQQAAEYLNGFNWEDIQTRLAELSAEEVTRMHFGALDNVRIGADSNVAMLTKPGIPRTSMVQPGENRSKAPPSPPAKPAPEATPAVVKVGNKVIGSGVPALGAVGGVLVGGSRIAQGALTVNGAVLQGGADVVLVESATLSQGAQAAKAVADVASTDAALVRDAWRLRLALAETSTAASAGGTSAATSTVAAETSVLVAAGAPALAIGIGFALGVGIALLPFAVAYAALVMARLGPFGGTLPPGGAPNPPMKEPGDDGEAFAPGGDAGAPVYTPGAGPRGGAVAPGAQSGHATAPGQSGGRVELSGVRIPLKPTRAERLEKAEKAEKWTDLPGSDRTSLGKAYNHIVQSVVREIASGGRAEVMHYQSVTKSLINELAKKGGRVIITEGRLPKGSRFDIAEIDFDFRTVELIDLTAVKDVSHAGKTGDYASELEKLTGFPVSAFEARYVDDNKLADEIVFIKVK